MMPIFYRRDLVGEHNDDKSNGAKSDDDVSIQTMLISPTVPVLGRVLAILTRFLAILTPRGHFVDF